MSPWLWRLDHERRQPTLKNPLVKILWNWRSPGAVNILSKLSCQWLLTFLSVALFCKHPPYSTRTGLKSTRGALPAFISIAAGTEGRRGESQVALERLFSYMLFFLFSSSWIGALFKDIPYNVIFFLLSV